MIAAFLSVLLQTGQVAPKTSAADEWICTASVRGKRDARVDISVEVAADRDIFIQNVGWAPPKASRPATSRPDVRAPGLTLFFEYAEPDDIAELSSALGEVSSIDAPAGTLDDMALAVRIDQGDTWYVAIEATELDREYRIGKTRATDPADDHRSAWLANGDTEIDPIEALGTARIATLSVVNRKGHPVSRTSYDLSATAERDRLFAKAWKQAERLARRPERCTRVGDE